MSIIVNKQENKETDVYMGPPLDHAGDVGVAGDWKSWTISPSPARRNVARSVGEVSLLPMSQAELSVGAGAGEDQNGRRSSPAGGRRGARLASLDVFRGLSIFLMILVDYLGPIFPLISHSPWNGLHLADFVMPFFLFIAGMSLALAYKRVESKVAATFKVAMRTIKLFLLGALLQGGYFHGVNSLTFGVDIEKIRWLGILQRIAIGYFIAALCEVWLPFGMVWSVIGRNLKSYHVQWFIACSLCIMHMTLLFVLFVPDWQFELPRSSSLSLFNHSDAVLTVKCGARGDLGPACNSAGMIDRDVLGVNHMYWKPVYRNLKECLEEISPSWCHAPFEPEGISSSLGAVVACIIGLQFGHGLRKYESHKDRLQEWLLLSAVLLFLGLALSFTGIPLNKSLYTTSYLLVTCAAAGFTFSALYVLVRLVDVHNSRHFTFVFECMGRHSLSVFILVASNLVVIMVQGFYINSPENNLVHWIISQVKTYKAPRRLPMLMLNSTMLEVV